MVKINLAPLGRDWQTANDFYGAFFTAVGAPRWHGRNLDALNDSIGTGSINKIEVPYTLRISGLNSMSKEAQLFIEKLACLVAELKTKGVEVNLVTEP